MNRSAVARIILWSVIAIVLAGFLFAALAFDGMEDFLGRLGLGWTSFRYDETGYSIGNFTTESEITSIKIYWTGGKIDLSVCSGNELLAEEASDYEISTDEAMRYLIEEGVLTIRARKSGIFFRIGKSQNKHLTLRIPESMAGRLSLILLDSVSAEVSISKLSAETLRSDCVSGDVALADMKIGSAFIDHVSGDLRCSNVTADYLKMDSVSGACQYTGSVKKLDFDSTSGDITVDSSEFPSEMNTDTVSGNAFFTIPEGAGFTAELDSVSGTLNCGVPVVSDGKTFRYGDASAIYRFESVSGNVTIRLKN